MAFFFLLLAPFAARLRKLEQRTGIADAPASEDDSDSSEEEVDIAKLRQQAKQRMANQEGRSAFATRAGEKQGVRMLEERLKGSPPKVFRPPVGAGEWVDEMEAGQADD